MNELKIKYVGKVEELKTGEVVKTYYQKVSGSAWKKIGSDIILLNQAGYDKILLKINSDHPNIHSMLEVCEAITTYFPNVKVEEVQV